MEDSTMTQPVKIAKLRCIKGFGIKLFMVVHFGQ